MANGNGEAPSPKRITWALAAIASIVTILGALQAWFVLPWRMKQQEDAFKEHASAAAAEFKDSDEIQTRQRVLTERLSIMETLLRDSRKEYLDLIGQVKGKLDSQQEQLTDQKVLLGSIGTKLDDLRRQDRRLNP